jgi:hypothetical protein
MYLRCVEIVNTLVLYEFCHPSRNITGDSRALIFA